MLQKINLLECQVLDQVQAFYRLKVQQDLMLNLRYLLDSLLQVQSWHLGNNQQGLICLHNQARTSIWLVKIQLLGEP